MCIQYPAIDHKITMIVTILCVSIAIYLIFSIAPKVLKYTGEAGLKSFSKIMGFLVLAIGIEMIVGSILAVIKSV